MRRIFPILLLALLAGCCLPAMAQEPRVRIATQLGDIVVALDQAHAPATAANFLRYVDEKSTMTAPSIARSG